MRAGPYSPLVNTSDAAALPADTGIGRVGLRVDDLDHLLPFYREVIGCTVERGDDQARLCADGGEPLVVLEASPGATPRPRDAAGLFHVAIRLPTRAGLAATLERIRERDVRLSGASDHLVSEALYLEDPAGNGLELYWDRPRSSWSRTDDGRVEMATLPLDLGDLAAAGGSTDSLPVGADVGHVHLETTDLADAMAFYVERLGLAESSGGYPEAAFLAAGGYHHHVGLNRWNRRTAPIGEHQGLRWFEVVLPDAAARSAVRRRFEAGGLAVEDVDGRPAVTGPDGVGIRLALGENGG